VQGGDETLAGCDAVKFLEAGEMGWGERRECEFVRRASWFTRQRWDRRRASGFHGVGV